MISPALLWTWLALPGHAADHLMLLGAPPLEGDPGAPARLLLWSPHLRPEVRVTVKPSQGEIGPIEVFPDGTAAFSWTAPAGGAGGELTLDVRFKAPDGQRIAEVLKVPVAADPATPPAITASPAVLSPEQASTTLQIRMPASGQAPAKRQLQAAASFGQLGPVQIAADGTATVTWTRPASMPAARAALIVVWDPADPGRRAGSVVVPVQVKRAATFEVEPDSRVQVLVDGAEIGAGQASPAGTLGLDLVLDPRVREATLSITTPFGVSAKRSAPLPPSAGPQLALGGLPTGPAPRDPRVVVPVLVGLTDGAGLPSTAAPALTASAGELSAPRRGPGGLWIADWRPPAAGATALITAEADGQRVSAQVTLGPPLPMSTLTASPAQLAPGRVDVELQLRAQDPSGQPWTGTTPIFGAGPGSLAGKPTGAKGDYKVKARAEGGALAAFAGPPPADAGPPAELIAWIERGPAGAALRVAVTDARGVGVGGVPVQISVVEGKGAAPASLTTRPGGLVEGALTLPEGRPLTLQLQANGVTRTLSALPAGSPAPEPGDAGQIDLLARWQRAAPSVQVGTAAPVVAAAPAPAPAPTAGPTVTAAPAAAPAAAAADPTAAAAAPSARPARAPSDRPEGGAWGEARVRGALRWAPGSRVYRSDQEGFEAGPEEATWFHGDLARRDPLGEGGVGLGGLAWFGDRWGAELDLRWTKARVLPDFTFPSHEEAVDDAGEPLGLPDPDTAWDYTEWTHTAIAFRLMGRYRQDLPGPLYAFGGAGLGRAETVLFTWSDRAPELVEAPMFGGRVAAGAGLDLGRVWAEVAIGELLSPWPVSTELDADLDIGILPELALRLGADLGWRRATFDVDGSEIEVVDAAHSLNIGIVGTLR